VHREENDLARLRGQVNGHAPHAPVNDDAPDADGQLLGWRQMRQPMYDPVVDLSLAVVRPGFHHDRVHAASPPALVHGRAR
jgi:hypothetical protein